MPREDCGFLKASHDIGDHFNDVAAAEAGCKPLLAGITAVDSASSVSNVPNILDSPTVFTEVHHRQNRFRDREKRVRFCTPKPIEPEPCSLKCCSVLEPSIPKSSDHDSL